MKIFAVGATFISLLQPSERRRFLLIVALIVLNGIVETVGVVSVLPFLAVAAAPAMISENKIVSGLYGAIGNGDPQHFLTILGIATALALAVANGLSALTQWVVFHFTYTQQFALARRLLRTYLLQPYSFFLKSHTVDLARNVYDEVPRVVTGVLVPAIGVLSKSVSVVFIVGLLVAVNPLLAGAALLTFGGAYYVLRHLVQDRLTQARASAAPARAWAMRSASDALSAVKELKIRRREAWAVESYARAATIVADGDAKNQILVAIPRNLLETLAFGGIVALALVLLSGGQSAAVAIPVVALYALAGYRLLPALQQIYSNLNYVQYYYPSFELIVGDLVSLQGSASSSAAPLTVAPPPRGDIALSAITFTYAGAANSALSGVSLDIGAGRAFGIVGVTGSGKSTLLDVLVGLLEPDSGTLKVGGVRLQPSNLGAWQSQIGYVQQHTYLADDTIAANITYGIPKGEIDRERMIAAARVAQLHDFVTGELPQGYDTLIGERGGRLSGGQRQRVGLARAIYNDPAVLILDEAMSALDSLTEASVLRAVRAWSADRTIIMVSHRLHMLESCDRIVVLEHGRVSGVGTFAELIKSSLTFRDMARVGSGAGEPVA